jgi:ABC-2 type transport system permease protein
MSRAARVPVGSWFRIFFIGGLTSYRALFHWIRPSILIPTFMVVPFFQILLFVYLGRGAHLASDGFFVVGNALQSASIPCLFAMGNTIAGERQQHTLQLILATPAPRLPLFLGRALPVIANGFLAAAFSLAVAAPLLGVGIALSAVPALALAILVTSASCTGLGLANAAIGLRVRETAVTANLIIGLLMVFCGVNIPLDRLPGWMARTAEYLPLTHGIAAARHLADGAGLRSVAGLLGHELVIGLAYAVLGFGLLRFFEWQSRRHATLDRI